MLGRERAPAQGMELELIACGTLGRITQGVGDCCGTGKSSHVIKIISELAMPVTAGHFQSIAAMAGEGHRVLAYRPLADATVKDSPTYTGLLGLVCDCAQAVVRSGRGGADIDQQVCRL